MGKKSRNRVAGSGKEDAGCMWGLINMFDFRQGYSRHKLLLDKKQRSARHSGSKYSRSKPVLLTDFEETEYDGLDNRGEAANKGRETVKSLMQEEMSRIHPLRKISSDEVPRIQSELELETHSQKYYEHSGESGKVVSDLVVEDPKVPKSLPSHQSNYKNSTERSSLDFDLATLFKFYGDNYQFQEKHMDSNSKEESCPVSKTDDCIQSEKHSMLHKALTDVANTFHNQKLIDMEKPSGALQSREFMGALEILKSNKDILFHLLKDPNSLLLKGIQDHLNPQDGKLSMLELGTYLEENELLKEVCSTGKYDGSISHKLFNKQNRYNIFKKKEKSKGGKPLNGTDCPHVLSRIVILKPSSERAQSDSVATSRSCPRQSYHWSKSQADGERIGSRFFIKEIQRRWRQVIGENKKERDLIYVDGILHPAPYGSKNSSGAGKQTAGESLTNKTCYDHEQDFQSSATPQKGDSNVKVKECQQNTKNVNTSNKVGNHRRLSISATAPPLNRESFYEEAKKHLIQILDTRDDTALSPTRQLSKSLGRLLSLPEYNLLSPRFSCGRDYGTDLPILQQCKDVNATNHSSPMIQGFNKTFCGYDNLDDEAEVIDLDPTLFHSHSKKGICPREFLHQKEIVEVVEKDDTVRRGDCGKLDVPSESDGNGLVLLNTTSKEEVSFKQLTPDSSQYKLLAAPSVSILPSSFPVQNMGPESILENPAQPSPMSVSECFSSEDVNNPGKATAEFSISSQSILFEEHENATVVLTSSDSEILPMTFLIDKGDRFEYVKAVLELPGLSCKEISYRSLSSVQLLYPSLFDEVEVSYSQLLDDSKLLFDCTCEALAAIQERHSSPWASFIKPNARPFPVGANLIQEVCRGIDRHVQRPPPLTLDDIVRKDMDGDTWLDLSFEAKNITTEMENSILEELIVETALDMWVELSLCGTISFLDDTGYCSDILI